MNVFVVLTPNSDSGEDMEAVCSTLEKAKEVGNRVAAKRHYAIIQEWELDSDRPVRHWDKADGQVSMYSNDVKNNWDWEEI